MNDPLDRATSSAPPTLGEGCVRRYDPAALSEESGSDFAQAAELWQRLHGPRDLSLAPEAIDGGAAAPQARSPADRSVD